MESINKKTIDKILPKWVYYLLLAIAVFYANYFYNMSVVYDTLGLFEFKSTAYISIIAGIFVAAAQFGIFELVSRFYYSFVSKGTGFKGLTCTKSQFVDTLRVFFIFKSVVVGTANITVYFFPYLIPLAVHIFNLLFSIVFYYLFFLYIKDKYINKEIGGRTFLYLAIPYLIYSVVVLIFNLVL